MLTYFTYRQIMSYMMLPQIGPRLKNFAKDGFKNIAYFMALIYRASGLLPENHSYLNTANIGTYSMRSVVAQASQNLVFDTKHIDQIIVFFALLAGIFLLIGQFALLLIAFLVNPASAGTGNSSQPQNYGDLFITQNPQEDLALRLLDRVFGVPDIFGSKDIADGSNSFHIALHQLLQFYSIGLLVIAMLIIIYFIFAILAETAQTGTPFGKRYNHAWAPIRLVVAIGLLIPIGTGLNSGQWITLYAAKFGSGFATNGWIKFNDKIKETYIPAEELVATPNVPALHDISAFMMVVHACKKGYQIKEPSTGDDIDAYLINDENGVEPVTLSATPFYKKAVDYSTGTQIRIRFGRKNAAYTEQTQNVLSHCGELVLDIPERIKDNGDGSFSTSAASKVNRAYYNVIRDMWAASGDYAELKSKAEDMMVKRLEHNEKNDPDPTLKEEVTSAAEKYVKTLLKDASDSIVKSFKKDQDFSKYGWGGAGIWYNKIAQVNGAIVTAIMNKPTPKHYPYPMRTVCEKNKQQNNETPPTDCYNTKVAKGKDAQFLSKDEKAIAAALSDVFDYWYKNPSGLTGNAFIDTINVIMGTQGIFDLCSAENVDIHPIALLSSAGKGLIDAAIRNLGLGLGAGIGGILVPYIGPALQSASGFLVTVASIGILIGFILFYLLPFLPFLYFFFAVGGWVKGIFEAMVGVPLWALAHIRIDGQGLPGDGAINGYFLIFEIFVRPILIVFGLLAALLTFAAMAKVLNSVFSLVTSNLSGFSGNGSTLCGTGNGGSGDVAPTGSIEYFRGPIDEFFFTIIYAIIIYLIATSTFKLIDMIPNNILRWMGAGVQTFNDTAGAPAEGLLTKIAVGGSLAGSQLQQAGSAAGQAGSGIARGIGAAFSQGGGNAQGGN